MSEKFEAGMVCTGQHFPFIVVYDRDTRQLRRMWMDFNGHSLAVASIISDSSVPVDTTVVGKLDGKALQNDITALIKGNGGTSW